VTRELFYFAKRLNETKTTLFIENSTAIIKQHKTTEHKHVDKQQQLEYK